MKKKILLLTFFSIVCTVLLFELKITPTNNGWNSYKIIYVEKDFSHDSMMKIFSSLGIDGVLSADHADYPKKSELLPVMKYPNFNGYSFLDLQNIYFRDRTGAYALYYIPVKYETAIDTVLKKIPVDSGCDFKTRVPFFSVFITAIFFIVLWFFSKNKLFFTATTFPLVLFCFTAPYIYLCTLSIIFMLVLYSIQSIWTKSGIVQFLLHFIPLFIIVPIFLLFSMISNIQVFILACLVLLLTVLLVLLCYEFNTLSYQKSFIQPLIIKKAHNVNWQKNLRPAILYVSIMTFVIIFPGSLLFSENRLLENSKELYIPEPSQYNLGNGFDIENYKKDVDTFAKSEDYLPNLMDYIGAEWYMETAPYSRLSNTILELKNYIPEIGSSVKMPDLLLNNSNLESENAYYSVFDSVYVSNELQFIDENSYSGGAERLLYSESSFTSGVWRNINIVNITIKSCVLAITSLILILCMVLYFARERKKTRVL